MRNISEGLKRAYGRTRAVLTVGAIAIGAMACSQLITGRPEDASASRDYRSAMRGHPACTPEVELIRSLARANRPYREVASLSSSCYPGVISECEQRLLERGCELKADAVILTEPKTGGTSPGGATDTRVSRFGLAVRWVESTEASPTVQNAAP